MPTSFRPESTAASGTQTVVTELDSANWADGAEQYRAILDAVPTTIGLVKDHRIVFVNQAFPTLLGYTSNEAGLLSPATYFCEPSQFETALRNTYSLITRGETYHSDFLMRRKNGECFWGTTSGRLLFREHPEERVVGIPQRRNPVLLRLHRRIPRSSRPWCRTAAITS